MKIPLIALPVFMILFFACKPQQPAKEGMAEKIPTLTRLWTTDTVLRTPESVLYDKAHDIIYVANVNLNPWEKDGNGFISRLDTKGNILELQWVSGLNGPKGMGILNDHLRNGLTLLDIV